MTSEISGKVCLVTGASRGIGAAVARGLGACGASVAVHYRSGRTEAEQVAAEIERSGGTALLVQGDIAEPRHRRSPRRRDRVAGFGRLDILINNAGDQISRVNIADILGRAVRPACGREHTPDLRRVPRRRPAVSQAARQRGQHHQRQLDRRRVPAAALGRISTQAPRRSFRRSRVRWPRKWRPREFA